jgi:Na+-translocating ferredoxin:NAD+ oxidoreductase RnfG subunit
MRSTVAAKHHVKLLMARFDKNSVALGLALLTAADAGYSGTIVLSTVVGVSKLANIWCLLQWQMVERHLPVQPQTALSNSANVQPRYVKAGW